MYLCRWAIRLLLFLATQTLHAKIYIDIESPEAKRIHIAIPSPVTMSDGKSPSSAMSEYHEYLKKSLDLTGIFEQIDPRAFLEPNSGEYLAKEKIDFRSWSLLGSEALLKTGYWNSDSEKKLRVLVRLFDVVTGEMLFGKTYETDESGMKHLAYRVANEVVKAFTGTEGFLGTKVAFISNVTGKKELYIMDIDGEDIRRITNHRTAVVSPSWSPDGLRLLFTSYLARNPDLYMYDFLNGKMLAISRRDGLNIGGSFSPDGKSIALTLSHEGNPEIYLLEPASGRLRRVTNSWGIDVSPSFSPDGRQIAFVSDRSGTPQIYIMDADGGRVKRLTFEGKYNASPRWSPDGKRIAYSGMSHDGINFHIFIMKPDGSEQMQITDGRGSNENPSWSPDSRYIMFSSTRDGNSEIYITSITGTYIRRLTRTPYDETNPAWSPFVEFKVSEK